MKKNFITAFLLTMIAFIVPPEPVQSQTEQLLKADSVTTGDTIRDLRAGMLYSNVSVTIKTGAVGDTLLPFTEYAPEQWARTTLKNVRTQTFHDTLFIPANTVIEYQVVSSPLYGFRFVRTAPSNIAARRTDLNWRLARFATRW